MDPISHGFWTAVVYKAAGSKTKKRFNLKKAVCWGVCPDFLAFTIPSVWLIYALIVGKMNLSNSPRPDTITAADSQFVYDITLILYNFSHSLVTFLIIFVLAYVFFKKIFWELGGWLMHILIDIPTHPIDFYPTPFLWPISDYRFSGLNWEEPKFMIINILATILVLLAFRLKKQKKQLPL